MHKNYRLLSALAAVAMICSFSPAVAADAVSQEAVPDAPAQITNWSGAYIAGIAGYESAKGHNEHLNVNTFGGPGGTYDHKGDGGIYGAAIGYNWEFNNGVVVGAELGIRSGTKLDDGGAFAIYNNTTETSLQYLGTAKARLGYDAGRWMPYVTAGVATGKMTSTQIYSPPALTATKWKSSKQATGYVVGAGVDYRVSKHVVIGVEYNYTDLGKVKFGGLDSDGTDTQISGHYKAHSVFARLAYQF